MQVICDKCGNKTTDAQYVEYLNLYLCKECYTEDIQKEESYYDFCQSCGRKYIPASESVEKEVLEDNKFFAK
ncbi:MAG: hypothetical protein RSC93_02535 [Erysipelotrichaceae bacterium]